jgi:hypothetical protein
LDYGKVSQLCTFKSEDLTVEDNCLVEVLDSLGTIECYVEKVAESGKMKELRLVSGMSCLNEPSVVLDSLFYEGRIVRQRDFGVEATHKVFKTFSLALGPWTSRGVKVSKTVNSLFQYHQ